MFRPHWVCPVQGVCAFPVYTAQAPGCCTWSGPCVECSSSFRVLHNSTDLVAPACCVFPSLSGSGGQRLGHSLPWCGAPFPSAAPARAAGRVSGSLQTGTGPVCRVGGGGFSGAEFAPFTSPLPPTSSGDGPALLWSFSVLRTAGSVFGLVNFSLLSHSLKKLPPTALRAFGPVLPLNNAARSSPFRRHLLVAGAGDWGTFLLGVDF